MHNQYDLQKKYESILLDYFSSQAFAYVLAGVFFLVRYAENRVFFTIGYIFCFISVTLILAPLSERIRTVAWKLDTWFRGGLFIATGGILIIDALLGSLRTDIGEIVFWTLLIWLFLLVIINALVISKRIGLLKFLVFGIASFGLLMILTGHVQLPYYIIAIIGLLLSVPVLDNILYKKLL